MHKEEIEITPEDKLAKIANSRKLGDIDEDEFYLRVRRVFMAMSKQRQPSAMQLDLARAAEQALSLNKLLLNLQDKTHTK